MFLTDYFYDFVFTLWGFAIFFPFSKMIQDKIADILRKVNTKSFTCIAPLWNNREVTIPMY